MISQFIKDTGFLLGFLSPTFLLNSMHLLFLLVLMIWKYIWSFSTLTRKNHNNHPIHLSGSFDECKRCSRNLFGGKRLGFFYVLWEVHCLFCFWRLHFPFRKYLLAFTALSYWKFHVQWNHIGVFRCLIIVNLMAHSKSALNSCQMDVYDSLDT